MGLDRFVDCDLASIIIQPTSSMANVRLELEHILS